MELCSAGSVLTAFNTEYGNFLTWCYSFKMKLVKDQNLTSRVLRPSFHYKIRTVFILCLIWNFSFSHSFIQQICATYFLYIRHCANAEDVQMIMQNPFSQWLPFWERREAREWMHLLSTAACWISWVLPIKKRKTYVVYTYMIIYHMWSFYYMW